MIIGINTAKSIEDSLETNIQALVEEEITIEEFEELTVELKEESKQKIEKRLHLEEDVNKTTKEFLKKADEIYTKEYRQKLEFDIDKLAYAVAMQETKNCTV